MEGGEMKRVVTGGDLTQRTMRPDALLDAYLAHAQADIARFELLQGGLERACPACSGQGEPAFVRLGFPYQRCATCRSLFVSPAPEEERLAQYHAEGAAERFRREQVLPMTARVRARHAVGPRARWVLTAAAARLGPGLTFAQFGVESPPLLEILRASASVVRWPDDLSDDPTDARVDGAIAFDVLERSVDFSGDLYRCRRALRPRGLLFVTTMSGDGFEVRMLGPRTAALVPPVHLQLLSRAGWRAALTREGFSLVEYSTPGELDVQAVVEVCRRDPDVRLPPILEELVRHEDEQVGRAFQDLLQQACLSSHVQLVAEAGTDESIAR
jgi:2-polyprenyl-6-hydroxyphenyl methylase/3-demethylubiquinone-9 3-methyltransferase